MPNPILLLNQQYILNGLGTVTYTVPTAGTYSVVFSTTLPEAIATGDGAGSGTGLGSGSGGGTLGGFALGGGGVGKGAVGQGFGADGAGYPQPPAYGSNETRGAAVSSGVSVVVNKNGSPVFTMPALSATQSAAQFKTSLVLAATDVITVVLASSTASDAALNGLVSQIAINQGL